MKTRFRKLTAAITALLLAVSTLTPGFAAAAEDVSDEIPSGAVFQDLSEGENPLDTGTTYYIATNGDDDNPGTMEAPKKTGSSVAGSLKPGDTVTAGQKLGTVGTISCECAEEAHIHLEVLQNGQYLDPAKIS